MPRGKGYYAVANGRETGVYSSWDACKEQVNGYSNAEYKRFDSAGEARAFASGGSGSSSGYSSGSYGGGGRAKVYTDGACANNGQYGARAGVGVYWGPGDSYNTSEPLRGSRQTNNAAEIEAARQGIEQARNRGYDSVEVNTDSKFLCDAATKWMPKWQQNDYTLSTGGPVKNRSDFERLDKSMTGMDVSWKHVPGHSGVHGNEQADRLATQGARKHRY